MSHTNSHEHDHGPDHTHSHAPDVNRGNQRRVLAAMCLTAGFMVAEVVGGVLSGSLALIADAGHMATDAAALFLAYIAFRLVNRPADANQSYGYHRAETLAAFVNALTMIALVGWILFEAVQRFFEPVEILGGLMLWVAIGGLLVNVLAFLASAFRRERKPQHARRCRARLGRSVRLCCSYRSGNCHPLYRLDAY